MSIAKLKWGAGLAVISLLAFSGSASAEGLGLGIATAGSPHNFADNIANDEASPTGKATLQEIDAGGWNQTGEICRVCHIPHDHHDASQRYLNGLLWNHNLSSATYTMYDHSWSSTIQGPQSAQPDGIAKLCLSCHDGTVAIDAFDEYTGTAGNEIQNLYNDPHFQVPGFADGGNRDLRSTHPISIQYRPDLDPNLHNANDPMGTSGSINDVLDNGKVQCSSCHDVHDQEAVADTHLLRVAQTVAAGGTASGLCLTCHIK